MQHQRFDGTVTNERPPATNPDGDGDTREDELY